MQYTVVLTVIIKPPPAAPNFIDRDSFIIIIIIIIINIKASSRFLRRRAKRAEGRHRQQPGRAPPVLLITLGIFLRRDGLGERRASLKQQHEKQRA